MKTKKIKKSCRTSFRHNTNVWISFVYLLVCFLCYSDPTRSDLISTLPTELKERPILLRFYSDFTPCGCHSLLYFFNSLSGNKSAKVFLVLIYNLKEFFGLSNRKVIIISSKIINLTIIIKQNN